MQGSARLAKAVVCADVGRVVYMCCTPCCAGFTRLVELHARLSVFGFGFAYAGVFAHEGRLGEQELV